jgi:hypothetical protein
VDEGVKMKGEDTIIGTGVRQINARFKLVLTATPIKNRLPDVFRLAWWSTGARAEAHARFPYPDSSAARDEFASEFLISERNLSKEKESHSKSQRYKKLTPQVCNVHRLWKMFAPIILRRRKADFGEEIVPKLRQVVRVPMGAEQAAVYRYHLKARYTDKNGKPAIGAQLQALRIAAANAASELLVRPCGDGTKGQPRSRTAYIPKLHAALKLIHQGLERGEQAIVFSAFHDSLDALSARLAEAGVAHCVADGRISQKRCAALAAQFKLGPGKSPWPVMLAGVDCMSEGHSFNLCNNVTGVFDVLQGGVGGKQRAFGITTDFDPVEKTTALPGCVATGNEKIHHSLVTVGRDADLLARSEQRINDTRCCMGLSGAWRALDHEASTRHRAGHADGSICCGLAGVLQRHRRRHTIQERGHRRGEVF